VTLSRHRLDLDRMDIRPRLALVAGRETVTNRRLLEAAGRMGFEPLTLRPGDAHPLGPSDLALGRLDVLPGLDGPEPGLEGLRELEVNGVSVLNRAGALLGAHDKLVTALRLSASALPHPRTAHIGDDVSLDFEFPVVVKPRFGSWGQDVTLCTNRAELRRCLRAFRQRPWFQRQGALVQELVDAGGRDLRVLVAGGEVVGAVARVAAPGEWRTNVALGGSRQAAVPPPAACYVATRAAEAIGADLVGVDLLPNGEGGWVVIELNGAVDFTDQYSLDGRDVFRRAIAALARRTLAPPVVACPSGGPAA
jgi:[lysine-biosynthesis-protein LysW]--L-2-aminoadipate ligase